MTKQGWVIVDINGDPVWKWASYKKKVSQDKATDELGFISWNKVLALGYRCMRCQVVEVK